MSIVQFASIVGAKQKPWRRPDLTSISTISPNLYVFLLHNPQHIGVYNAGFDNLSIREIADMVCEIADAEIVVTPSNDPRSCRVNSDKLLSTGFRPKKTVCNAIEELSGHYAQGILKNDPTFHNLKWMQQEMM